MDFARIAIGERLAASLALQWFIRCVQFLNMDAQVGLAATFSWA